MSETGAIWKALSGVQAELVPAKKDAKNPHLGNKYADLASCWEALQDVLPKHGLAVTQTGENIDGHCWLRTTLGHTSGETLSGLVPVVYGDAKGLNIMQAFGSAWTYARRYGLAAICGLTAEDDDGSGAGTPPSRGPAPATPPTTRPAATAAPAQQAATAGEKHVKSKSEMIAELVALCDIRLDNNGTSADDSLREWSRFKSDKDGKEHSIDSRGLDRASDKWIATTLKKARDWKKGEDAQIRPPAEPAEQSYTSERDGGGDDLPF